MVGSINLSGKTEAEAKKILEDKINNLNQTGINFVYGDKKVNITPVISTFEADLSLPIISFNTDDTVETISAYGHGQNLWKNFYNQSRLAISSQKIPFSFEISEDQLKKILADNFKTVEEPGNNAELEVITSPNNSSDISFKIKEEKVGFIFDYDQALQDLKNNLKNLDNSDIKIKALSDYPAIKKDECSGLDAKAKEFLDKASLTLTLGDKKWPIEKKIVADWLSIARENNGQISLSLNDEKIKSFLAEKISPEVEIIPQNARFEIKDGRVIEFSSSQDGQKINEMETIAKLKTDFLLGNNSSIELVMETFKSEVKNENVNNLGVKEIIGTGHSNFSGSPKNRIHNIQIGAAAMNGILIAPGEEFSTIKTLGEISEKTGYLQELVIKGNKTIPEFGGGLCQVGTTMFRVALASGLPITERQNHSYRVSYYEPVGTDATIYDPQPDLRFINDSGYYILIQSRIDGNDLYFDFWGTDDGRVVEQTDPVISNIVTPAPAKIVETTDLKPGEKKCTEHAHNGADVSFNYKVIYPNGEIKERLFKSHYVPWQEVCLIGVKATSTATSTAIVLP